MSPKKKHAGNTTEMARTYRTVNRVFAILTLLEHAPHGLNVREVFQRLEPDHPADERTYRRDLENLEILGFLAAFEDPSDDTRSTRYKTNRTLQVGRTLTLELRELFALYVARNLLAPLRDTPLHEDLEHIFGKIEKYLGPKAREHLVALSAEVHFEPGPRWGLGIDAEVLDVVERCCAEGHVLCAQYKSVNSGDLRRRTLGPHFLYFAKGSLYLVAEDLEDKTVKTFAIPRMSDAEMTERAYAGENVDPEHYFASAFGVFRGDTIEHVELVFSPPWAAHVRERRWHASQRIVPCSDGTVRMSLDVAITPELTQWVLGFGDGVHIDRPEGLVREILAAAKSVVAHYGNKKAA